MQHTGLSLDWSNNSIELLLLLCWLSMVVKLALAVWPRLRSDSALGSRAISAAFLCFGLWQLRAGIFLGLEVHLVAGTLLVLCFGWQLSLLIASVSLLLQWAFGYLAWPLLASRGLLLMAVMSMSYLLFAWCYHHLPRHFFVYIFVCGFLSAGLLASSYIGLQSLQYWLLNYYSWPQIADNFLILALLMWFPEATLTGMLLTLLVVYRPQWVSTFFDREYLNK